MIPIKDENPTRTFPLFTISIILVNIFIFFKYNFSMGSPELERLFYDVGLVPKKLFHLGLHKNLKQLFTHIFFHGDIVHLGGNMLFLWIFGNNIEDVLGKLRFLIFYFVCGFIAALLQAFMSPTSTFPMIGASGAIAGILGAYLLLFPRARVLVVIPIFIFLHFFWVPAVFVLSLWFIIQILSGYFSHTFLSSIGGVAWFAHIGGFLSGIFLVYPLLWSRDIFSRKNKHQNHFNFF